MKDFNIAKYLKEHSLGSHGILGKYVDLHALKEEDYGNNKASKEPYEGPEDPIDGLGYKMNRDMDVSMNEAEGDNSWMKEVDFTDEYSIDKWKCGYEYPGILVWGYDDIPFEKLAIYATPNYDGDGVTPIQVDQADENVSNMTLPRGEFGSFDEYALAMKPYLDKIEKDFGNIDEEVTVSSSGVEMGEEDSFIQAQRDAASGFESQNYNRMMGLIDTILIPQLPKLQKIVDAARSRGLRDSAIFKMLSTNSTVAQNIKDLVDDGFDPQDIVDFFGTDYSEDVVAEADSFIQAQRDAASNIDLTEYDTLLGAIENLLQSGETEKNILQVVKDTLGIK